MDSAVGSDRHSGATAPIPLFIVVWLAAIVLQVRPCHIAPCVLYAGSPALRSLKKVPVRLIKDCFSTYPAQALVRLAVAAVAGAAKIGS